MSAELPFADTHDILVQRAVRWLRNTRRCSVVFAEMSCAAPLIPDALGWHIGFSILLECKTSRSDFRADRKKPIHRHLSARSPGLERFYLTPPGLVTATEVPDGWGLLEAHRRQIRVVKPSPTSADMPTTEFDSRRASELPFLLSALRRHQLGVEWRGDIARFKPMEVTG